MAKEPIGVMVGVIADSYRMRPTKIHWNNLLKALSKIIGREIEEIHTRDFYSGNSPWRNLTSDERSGIITAIFEWLRVRKHSIVYAAVDKKTFSVSFHSEPFYKDVNTLWRFMALHVALSLQKSHQGPARNKTRKINPSGSCVLIFDNEHREEGRFTDLILDAPDWTDSYYDKLPNQEKFSQIVDVPHFVDSRDVGLIQLADFLSFFLRKHLELKMGYVEPAYRDEIEKVEGWVNILLKQSIDKAHIYKTRGRFDCAELFCRYAPTEILEE